MMEATMPRRIIEIAQPTYPQLRSAFLKHAEKSGARIASYTLPHYRGPADEELALDTCYIGPEEPKRLFAMSSGVHGVENAAFCAIFCELLEGGAENSLPKDAGLLLVHAVNPYGTAWRRRVTEDNVDLNRNFLKHPGEHVENREYDDLHDLINPREITLASELKCAQSVKNYIYNNGKRRLLEVLTKGQYKYPDGAAFGGLEECRSNVLFRRIIAEQVPESVRLAIWIDGHTGLGQKDFRSSELRHPAIYMLTEFPRDSINYRKGRKWYGECVLSPEDKAFPFAISRIGTIDGAVTEEIQKKNPDARVAAFCVEVGTYSLFKLGLLLRRENWLHTHGRELLSSRKGEKIKKRMYEVFYPALPAWRHALIQHGAWLAGRTAEALQNETV